MTKQPKIPATRQPMTKRKPAKKSKVATADRLAPVLAKVRDTIAEGRAVIDKDKGSKPPAPPASPPAANTAQKQQPPKIPEAKFDDGQAEGQLFVKLPGTPNLKHKSEPPPSNNRKGLRVISSQGESYDEMQARIAFSTVYLNANTAKLFVQTGVQEKPENNLDTTACAAEMVTKVEALDKGDTTEIQHQLLSQAVALQAIFGELARRAALNMGTYIEPTEVYLRLALKAQSQCRATLETLAEIKNPRPVYLNPRQVNNVAGNQQNNSTDGPQQVNNGSAPEPVRAEENKKPENKLLETG